MTVWIVQGDDYEDNGVRSVWSSYELALDDLNRRSKMRGNDQLSIEEYEVDPKDKE